MSRYGIAEWYGEPFVEMSSKRRQELASVALGSVKPPLCPFQRGRITCGKRGGVCSFQRYEFGENDRLKLIKSNPVIICPQRFQESDIIIRWLAEVVGLDELAIRIAKEVPFMRSTTTDKAAGRIDLVLADDNNHSLVWFGLEIQAVYFSGRAMRTEFERLLTDSDHVPPFPDSVRRPDWRSSSAKRLMPQLQVKVPTLRRWGTKLAVAVDRPFFEAIGGRSSDPIRDLDEGEVIWLVPEVSTGYRLERWHWETLSLDDSTEKLLAARTINRRDFERTLRAKLQRLDSE